MSESIGFIGGGRVTRIILGGWQNAGLLPGNIAVSDPDEALLQRLKEQFPTTCISAGDNKPTAASDIVFLALHPPVLKQALLEIKDLIKPTALVISLAPKYTILGLSAGLGGFTRIMRMIPNAPSIINQGYNPFCVESTYTCCYKTGIGPDDKKALIELLSPLGEMPEVAEEKLEAYAILSGMGPTYFWFQLETLLNIANELGLSPEEGSEAISAMLKGTIAAMFDSGLTPAEVKNLIPVHPLKEAEQEITETYTSILTTLYNKIKP